MYANKGDMIKQQPGVVSPSGTPTGLLRRLAQPVVGWIVDLPYRKGGLVKKIYVFTPSSNRPDVSVHDHRGGRGSSRVPVELALGVTLWRLKCPASLLRDRIMWELTETTIAKTFDLTIDAIYDRWGHLHELQHEAILPKIDMFCQPSTIAALR